MRAHLREVLNVPPAAAGPDRVDSLARFTAFLAAHAAALYSLRYKAELPDPTIIALAPFPDSATLLIPPPKTRAGVNGDAKRIGFVDASTGGAGSIAGGPLLPLTAREEDALVDLIGARYAVIASRNMLGK